MPAARPARIAPASVSERCLVALREHSPRTTPDLVKSTRRSRSRVNRVLNTLAARGQVERRRMDAPPLWWALP